MCEEGRQCARPLAVSLISLMDRLEEANSCHSDKPLGRMGKGVEMVERAESGSRSWPPSACLYTGQSSTLLLYQGLGASEALQPLPCQPLPTAGSFWLRAGGWQQRGVTLPAAGMENETSNNWADCETGAQLGAFIKD
uniref:Uncharacterized protein n=1 Tax=Sphaerodactylus townsendi TaxID=933632 RepID=A0ACB8GD62_9SAUR